MELIHIHNSIYMYKLYSIIVMANHRSHKTWIYLQLLFTTHVTISYSWDIKMKMWELSHKNEEHTTYLTDGFGPCNKTFDFKSNL